MRYPQSFVERLKQMATASSVIGKRIQVTRAGKEFKACCPFHNEKTPSFTINDAKGFYHCFGCGEHGDVIGFISAYERISYREAIETLAGELGVALPQPDVQEQKRERRRLDLQEINELACQWFEMQLQTTTGATARDYLDQRGLRAETIRHFRLGFAPDDRQALMKALGGHGVEMKDMIAAGLVVKNDRGEHYSRFRGRIMFPITTPRAQVIAFGGRIMDAQANPNAPKYLNSPETELFHKGEQLYHYGEARQAAQKEALVVCEGYMDVIALHQAGHHAAVAPLGTAMTESQLRLCWAACDTPVLALDGDAAGVRAMQRAADVALPMLQPGKSLKILTLPAGEDPDTLVRSGGLGAWNRALAASQDLAQLLWQRIAELPDGSPEQRAAMDQSAEALCERIAHSGVQQHYRDFFRDRLREMRRPVFQPGGSGRTPQRSGSKTGPMRLPPLPDPQNNHAMQERISMHLLGLFCIAPSLLAHADSEHVLMHSPLPAPWQKVADHLLHWSAAQPDLKAAGLADALQLSLQNTLGADLWQRFAGAWLPRHSPDNTQHADMLYRQLMQRWQHRAMLMEYQAFQREHAGKMDEETYRRLQALQQQLRLSEQSAAAMPDAWMTE